MITIYQKVWILYFKNGNKCFNLKGNGTPVFFTLMECKTSVIPPSSNNRPLISSLISKENLKAQVVPMPMISTAFITAIMKVIDIMDKKAFITAFMKDVDVMWRTAFITAVWKQFCLLNQQLSFDL